MMQSKTFIMGITGVLVFILTTIIAGMQFPGYNHIAQFISELYAVDAPNADFIRYYFYLPSGLLMFFFGISAIKEAPKSTLAALGFLGVGFAYGLGTVICALFNCDAGCNPDFNNPSLSQAIHNLVGFFTYLLVPFSILFVAIGSAKWKNARFFSAMGFVVATISFIFFVLLNTNWESSNKGLFQRIIEGSILLWIIVGSFYILKTKKDAAPQ